jgi:hypothetical protein
VETFEVEKKPTTELNKRNGGTEEDGNSDAWKPDKENRLIV